MWTGIPVFKLTEAESQRLVRMEEELHKRVIGQDAAIVAVSKSIRRARAGIKDPKRPTGSFIFLGPSGVGKTELARTLAEFLFGDEDAMIQIDMSEYMEKHAVSRLVGSPPGYIGYDEGGQLTEAVRRKPYSVVLFDEIEKAHPDVFNILLQILEDGKLTDSQGRKVDFRNVIVIMTSNIGSASISKNVSLGFNLSNEEGLTYDDMKTRVMGDLKKVFRPELLNRIDEIIVFPKLAKDEILQIVDLLHEPPARADGRARGDDRADRRGEGPARREGLRPGDGRPAAAPRDPALHRGPARRLRPRPRSSSPARRSSSPARTTKRSTSRSSRPRRPRRSPSAPRPTRRRVSRRSVAPVPGVDDRCLDRLSLRAARRRSRSSGTTVPSAQHARRRRPRGRRP